MSSLIASRSAIRNVFTGLRAAVAASNGARCSSTMHDNDPEVLETEKQRNLSNTQHKTSTPHTEHAPGWNEHLASASEASVKADRSTGSLIDLQRKTVNYIHSRHSPDDRTEPTEAFYSHDEVTGPLSGAVGVTDGAGSGVSSGRTVTKKVVHDETTKVIREWSPTPSEEMVKADRGEI